ncbi:protein of unknown function [Pseudarcicella hirudinis]|uniref:Ferric-dicitrate binding protein FerR, regulates iron transport through sigma-19 n=1 Tax=Pseudarcicella hirudinis TaxID=1079859 RepID=A0A1I5TM50_9BACT|nr:FecR family protein [Pseudarcicella hirudinis]SFP84110.1 protein of unknown function [Pseudarcicella hirudinis]
MDHYSQFTVEDFVQDIYFRNWVLDKLSSEDKFWENWLSAHPGKYELIEQAKAIIIALEIKGIPIDPDEISEEIDKILADTSSGRVIPFYRRSGFQMVASIALLIGLSIVFLRNYQPQLLSAFTENLVKNTKEEKVVNDTNRPMQMQLSDGTSVTLEKNSVLRISKDFGNIQREVFLSGEAFFKVSRDPERPFLVHTGKLTTKVLGTSFRIKAYDSDKNISVSVRTGKVTVFKGTEKPETTRTFSEEIILLPNQRGVFEKEQEKLVKTLVDQPVLLNTPVKFQHFEFEETPVGVVFNTLEKSYGVKINYDAEQLNRCTFTASLREESLYEKLDIICETMQAHYEIADGQIMIYGKGCN